MKQSPEERKAQWHANNGQVGSRFIKFYPSELTSRRHGKNYRAKRGVFAVRCLQWLAGRDWKGAAA